MSTQKYFHDRVVLLLLSANIGLAILTAVSLLFRLSSSSNQVYITQFRQNCAFECTFKQGGKSGLISFIIFVLLVTGFHAFMSKRIYHVRRHLSLIILGLGTVLIVMAAVVSNALLGLSL
jgi:hypothetical protein